MDKEKETKKLDAEELEKRVAPFAGPPDAVEEPGESGGEEEVVRGKKGR